MSIPKKSYVTVKTTITVDLMKLGEALVTSLQQGNIYVNIAIASTEYIKALPELVIDTEFNKTQLVRF